MTAPTLDHNHTRHEDCCSTRASAALAFAGSLSDDIRTPDVRDILAAKNSTSTRRNEPNDKVDVLVLGSIATANPDQPTAEAMGISDGRIVAIGTRVELDGLTGDKTQVVDSSEGVIIPGLIEPHMHLWSTGLFFDWEDCSHESNPTFDDVVARMKAAAAKAKPGEWICGQLFDPSLYPGEPDLTAAILDQVSADLPVVVANASMHFMYVNSAAFKAAGITAETPDPPSGKFYRVDGKLTGVVGEANGLLAIARAMPQKNPADFGSALRGIMNAAAERGVTSMREAMTGSLMGVNEFGLLHQLNAAAMLPTRISTAQASAIPNATWAEAGIIPGFGDDMVKATAWKVIGDGSNQGRSAYLRESYLGRMGEYGAINYSLDQFKEYIREGHEAGWQVMVHANGDAAADVILTAYEGVLAGAAPHDLRHRMEHLAISHPEHFRRMAALGISPSFLIGHVYWWGRALRDNILGPARAAGLHPVNTALSFGLRPSLHSDYNVSPIHPLRAASIAALRTLKDGGEVLGADERISAAQALRTVTTDAAWQVHQDDCGSLEVGKWADYAIASANPWTTSAEEWPDITFTETRIGGEVAWRKP